MASRTIAFLLGVLSFQQLPHLPEPESWLWGGALAILLLVPWLRYGQGRPGTLLGAALFLALGFGWAGARAAIALSDALPEELEGRDLVVEGVIRGLPQDSESRLRFDLVPEAVFDEGRALAWRGAMRLSWYQEPPELHAGERWRLTARLKRPHGMVNPGGFDYEGHLYQQGVQATGYVRKGAHVRIAEGAAFPVDRLRETVRERMEQALGTASRAGVVVALAIGDGNRISDEEWDLFRATGITHLMAISGLHVGMVGALAAWLARRAWRSPRLIHRWPAPKAAAGACVAAAALYALLAGFSVPTQRTLVMIGAVAAALLLGRTTRARALLGVACWAVLLYDPLAVLAPGFWLSFGAVALILYTMAGRLHMEGLWWRWGRMQWTLALGLVPLLVAFFGGASVASPLVNLFAVPWISLLVVPLTLVGMGLLFVWEPPGTLLLQSANGLLEAMWPLLTACERGLPLLHFPQPPVWVLAGAMAGLLWLLAPRGWPARWLGAAWCVPLFLWQPPRPAEGEVWLTVLDVGQGLAAVVETRERVLVFDTGPRWGPDFDTGEAVVEPFLRQRGWPRVDALVLSHGDNDHMGGARSLMDAFPVERTVAASPAKVTWAPSEPCQRGMQWVWNGVRFETLHPATAASDNDGSCVLRVAGPGGAALLTGDIEAAAENALVRRSEDLRARVLVVPHHGSRSSSTEAFLDAVRPEVALFSVGYRNRYRFPHPAVVARYDARQVRRFETASDGSVTIRLMANGAMESRRWREESRRYWRWG